MTSIWDLDLGLEFGTWIWDLDFELDLGLTILVCIVILIAYHPDMEIS